MSDNIPDEVKTSITLEDNVTSVCDKIMNSMASLLNCFYTVNDELGKGFSIDSNIDLKKQKVISCIGEIKKEYENLNSTFKNGLDIKINENISKDVTKKPYISEMYLSKDSYYDDRLNYNNELLKQQNEKNNQILEYYNNRLKQDKLKKESQLRYYNIRNLQMKAREEQKLKYENEKANLKNKKILYNNNIYTNKNNTYIPVSNARKDLLEGIRKDIKNSSHNYSDVHYLLDRFSNIYSTIFNKENIKKAIDASDVLSQLKSRIYLLNESFNKKNGTSEDTNSTMDYIYKSSQNSRTNYFDMLETVANIGTYSGNVFDNQKEVIDFSNLLLKVLRTNGISNNEALSVVNQITTTMNRGVLKGYELLSLFRKAPSIIEMVTETMKISEKQLEEMASKRGITSRALKDVFFINVNEINKNFEKIPMTWKDVLTRISNTTIKIFEPMLNNINKYANDKNFINNLETTVKKITSFISTISIIMLKFADIITIFWDIISPVLISIIAISTTAGIINLVQKFIESLILVKNTISSLLLVFTNPYIAGILLATASFIMLGKSISKSAQYARKEAEINISTYDVIMSILSAVFQRIMDISLFILGSISALGNVALKLFSGILDPFIAIWDFFSGTFFKVKSWFSSDDSIKNKAEEKYADAIKNFEKIFDDFNVSKNMTEGFNLITDDSIFEKSIGDIYRDELLRRYNEKNNNINSIDGLYSYDGIEKYMQDLLDELKKANNTLDISEDDMKYMRDIAERDAINRFTTAEIKVDMTNNNNINSELNIDGIVDALAGQIEEAMYVVAEGVH